MKNGELEDAFIFRFGVEVQIRGITGNIYVDGVVSTDVYAAGSLLADALDFDLLFGDGDLEVLRPSEDGVADVVFRLGAICAELGLVLDRVLELVVSEIRWNDLGGDVNAHSENA